MRNGVSLAEIYNLELAQWRVFTEAAESYEVSKYRELIEAVALGARGEPEKVEEIIEELMRLA